MKSDIFNFNLGLISKYRSELMGIATIGIIMCHAHAYDVDLPFHLNSILGLGQIGVMMFFFLSGLGLYYSSRALNGGLNGIGKWYKKRYIRLFLPYILIYGTALCAQMIDNQNLTGGGYLYRLSTLSYWFGDGGCWFVCVLVPLYLLTPFWNILLEKTKYPVIPSTIIMIAMTVFDLYNGAFYQAAFFFLGFWIARYVKTEHTIPTKWVLLIGLAFLMMLAAYYLFGFWGLLAILLVPLIWVFCIIFDKCKNTFINPIFRFFGEISLESYLFNTTLIIWINYFHLLPDPLYKYRYAFIVVFGILLSWCINRLCKPIINVLTR